MRFSAVLTVGLMFAALCFARTATREDGVVSLRLIDAATRRDLPGLVRIKDSVGRMVQPSGLLSRGTGLTSGATKAAPIHDWFVVTGPIRIPLRHGQYTIEAIYGLESELSRQSIDLTGRDEVAVEIPLVSFSDVRTRGWRSGNTHLHLKRMSRADADRYLEQIPRADGLDALFVSYLERAGDDQNYISNTYRRADLKTIGRRVGMLLGNGEEHRHNFAKSTGYGHVMFLNLSQLVQPVSLGPDIARMGTDGIPLRRGIDTAHRQPATVIWCHNNWGRERVPNLVMGRLDAQNIFDGSILSLYDVGFYRDLNAGFRIPFSTGTDWFLFDFSRVYVLLRGELSVENWLKSLAEGRTFITNGPLLNLTVDGRTIGEVVSLVRPGSVRVEARALGRANFKQIELVRNGAVIAVASSRRVGGHFEAQLELPHLPIKSPCWLALRTPPPPIDGAAVTRPPFPQNELGRNVFGHTSAIYIEVARRSCFDIRAAQSMLDEMLTNREKIRSIGRFADDQERARVLDVYSDGIAALQQHIAEHQHRNGNRPSARSSSQ